MITNLSGGTLKYETASCLFCYSTKNKNVRINLKKNHKVVKLTILFITSVLIFILVCGSGHFSLKNNSRGCVFSELCNKNNF